MSAFTMSFNDPASGTCRDNQADGFKTDETEPEASPDSQADGYKEPGTEFAPPATAFARPKCRYRGVSR